MTISSETQEERSSQAKNSQGKRDKLIHEVPHFTPLCFVWLNPGGKFLDNQILSSFPSRVFHWPQFQMKTISPKSTEGWRKTVQDTLSLDIKKKEKEKKKKRKKKMWWQEKCWSEQFASLTQISLFFVSFHNRLRWRAKQAIFLIVKHK